MLRASIVFFFIGLASMALGIYDVAGFSFDVGRWILFVCLIVSALTFIGALSFSSRARLR